MPIICSTGRSICCAGRHRSYAAHSWAVIAAVLAVLGMAAIKRRRVEQGCSRDRTGGVRFLCCSYCLFRFSLVFDLAAPSSILLGTLLGALAYCMCMFLGRHAIAGRGYERPRQLIAPFAGAAFIALLCVVVSNGFFVYSSPPSPADVESLTMSYVGSPNYLGTPVQGNSSDAGYYNVCDYTLSDKSGITLGTSLHRSFIDRGKRALCLNDQSFSDTVVPYDVKFSYKLKNGAEKTWYYDRASFSQLSKMLALDDSAAVKAAESRTILGENSQNTTIQAASAIRAPEFI